MTDLDKLAKGLTGAQRQSFLRDTSDPSWEPPMWIRAYDNRLLDYTPDQWRDGKIVVPSKLTWTPLGLALKAHIERNGE